MRIELYVLASEERFFCDFPCRLNVGDEVIMDIWPDYDEDKHQRVQDVLSVIFCKDKLGIYQKVYLTEDNVELTIQE